MTHESFSAGDKNVEVQKPSQQEGVFGLPTKLRPFRYVFLPERDPDAVKKHEERVARMQRARCLGGIALPSKPGRRRLFD